MTTVTYDNTGTQVRKTIILTDMDAVELVKAICDSDMLVLVSVKN